MKLNCNVVFATENAWCGISNSAMCGRKQLPTAGCFAVCRDILVIGVLLCARSSFHTVLLALVVNIEYWS